MLPFKKFKLTLDPCKIRLLRATFHIQFIALPEPFNLMYRSLKSDLKQERYKLGRFFVITLYKFLSVVCKYNLYFLCGLSYNEF
jgi:hypothetical protein